MLPAVGVRYAFQVRTPQKGKKPWKKESDNEQKKKGVAVIFVGEDLDVLIELCDRIMVMSGGRLSGVLNNDENKKQIENFLERNKELVNYIEEIRIRRSR